MKTLLTPLALCLSLSATAQNYSRNVAKDVPEGAHWGVPFANANVIVVTMADTPTVKQVADILLDHGHTVAAMNADLGTLSTPPEPFSKRGGYSQMVINARIKGRTVEYSGRVQSNVTAFIGGSGGGGEASAPVRCSYDQASAMRRAFEHLDEVARYTPGTVHYEKR